MYQLRRSVFNQHGYGAASDIPAPLQFLNKDIQAGFRFIDTQNFMKRYPLVWDEFEITAYFKFNCLKKIFVGAQYFYLEYLMGRHGGRRIIYGGMGEKKSTKKYLSVL
jgi:hypothetical protein